MRGRVLESALVADLLEGLEERGLVEAAAAIITGYLGSADNGAVIADFLARARARNPALLYVCDPVIGDEGSGVFVAAGVIDCFRTGLSRRPRSQRRTSLSSSFWRGRPRAPPKACAPPPRASDRGAWS